MPMNGNKKKGHRSVVELCPFLNNGNYRFFLVYYVRIVCNVSSLAECNIGLENAQINFET